MGRAGMPDPVDAADASIEHPQHRVTLTESFWLSRTPITQAQLVDVLPRERWLETSPFVHEGPDQPVDCVTWVEAARFCDALSDVLGIALRFDVHGRYFEQFDDGSWRDASSALMPFARGDAYTRTTGFRLPTEAEWEYASRAGAAAPSRFVLSPDELDPIAWHAGNSGGVPKPVGRKEPNAWGLCDMLGNVAEWVFDGAYRYYGAVPESEADLQRLGSVTDPIYEERRTGNRIRRGGDCTKTGWDCNSTSRGCYTATNRTRYTGFRVALSAG